MLAESHLYFLQSRISRLSKDIVINETVFNAAFSQAESAKTELEGLRFPEPEMHRTDLNNHEGTNESAEGTENGVETLQCVSPYGLAKAGTVRERDGAAGRQDRPVF